MGPGKSFGEVALLYGKPRNASVITQEASEFLVLHKHHYDRLLARFHEQQLASQVSFLAANRNLA